MTVDRSHYVTYDTAILSALDSKPRHRTEVVRHVAQRTGEGEADISASVFATLSALKTVGWVENGPRGYWRLSKRWADEWAEAAAEITAQRDRP